MNSPIAVSDADLKAAGEKLKDWEWRMDNLYMITDKDGQVIRFRMNDAQRYFFKNMHHRNVILKSRQLGFTTFKMLFMLDSALFCPHTRCAIICHTKDDATRLFDEKVKFAYNMLPDQIKKAIPATNDRAGELKFANGSSLVVGVSFRGGTIKYLHVSEFAKICAKNPDKAREVVTGAFEAVGKNGVITLESTAEGRTGYFYEYAQEAEKLALKGAKLSNLDWKFFFFPWDMDPQYQIESGEDLLQRTKDYFEQLANKTKKVYSEAQQRWYQLKQRTLGSDMKREYPSCPEEAFWVSLEGAFYERQFRTLYKRNQITRVPHDTATSVHTCWDIGVNDCTAIWFIQLIGKEWHVIDYYENSGEGLDHYIGVLNQKREDLGYQYGVHIGPHDLSVREFASGGKSRLEIAQSKGIKFDLAPKLPVIDGIEVVRNHILQCWFDEGRCETGLAHLQAYRKEWNDKLGVWRDKPLHDDSSNAADSFRYFCICTAYIAEQYSNFTAITPQEPISPLAWS